MSKQQDTPLDSLAPTSKLAQIAWVDGLRWAISDEEMLSQFRKDTGSKWVPARNPIDRMVDEAAGADRVFVMAFTRWFNQNVWGEVDGRACNGDEPEAP